MARRLPSLNQLRAFEAAARHQSIKDGAEELCVTPAAVGHQIKALERDLNAALFVRKTRKIVLTDRGQALASAVGQALDMLESAAADAQALPIDKELKLTVAPFFGNRWLLPRLAAFARANPGFAIKPSLSFDYVDLQQSDFDAALRFGNGDWPGLSSHLVFHDCIGPVCAPQLVSAFKFPMPPEEILALPLACAKSWPDDWEAWSKNAKITTSSPPPAIVEHDSRAFMFDAALTGQAVILADQRMTAADEEAGRLVRLHPLTVERPQGIFVVTAKQPPHPQLAIFVDWLRGQANRTLA